MQAELFHDDIYAAIGSVVEAIGGYKKVAGWLFPNKPINTAYSHLKACLRDDKPEKLDPQELILILAKGREAGAHDAMYFMADAANYERPAPSSPRDEMAKLQRDYIEAAKTMQQIALRIERVQIKPVD